MAATRDNGHTDDKLLNDDDDDDAVYGLKFTLQLSTEENYVDEYHTSSDGYSYRYYVYFLCSPNY